MALNTKDEKMSESKEPTTAFDGLFSIVRDTIAANDAETLDARAKEATERARATILGTVQVATVQEAHKASAVLGKLDPGEEAVGKSGWFWSKGDALVYNECDMFDSDDVPYRGASAGIGWFTHFIEAPKTGAALDAVIALIAEMEAGK